MMVSYRRGKVLGWGWSLLVLMGLAWYVRSYRPRDVKARDRVSAVAAREARVRAARSADVVLGTAGMDSVLAQFRSDSILLATAIPPVARSAGIGAELKGMLGELEASAGVRVTATEPLPAATEGEFQTAGYAIRLVGRYHAVGRVLQALSAFPALTRVRDLHLLAVPDSLIRTAQEYGGAAEGGASMDSAGVAGALADAGTPPFTAVTEFKLVWFTLPGDSAATAAAAGVPSTFATGGTR
jgi:hypothetical protein